VGAVEGGCAGRRALKLRADGPELTAEVRLRAQFPRPGPLGAGEDEAGASSFKSVLMRMLGVAFLPVLYTLPGGDAERVRSVSDG
jgi:hypothetical protein